MSNIKAVIIDDEMAAIENLSLLLQQYCSGIEIIGTAMRIDTGIELISKCSPDLVFLDISMPPEGNTFDLLDLFPKRTFEVVFVTAYHDYTMPALKKHVFDYLLKPIDYRELVKTVEEFKERQYGKIETVNPPVSGIIALPTDQGTHLVKDSDILYCAASGSYTDFFLENSTHITISKSLKHVESLLKSERFQRVHRSYIVNISKISKILKSDGGWLKVNDAAIPLSKKYVDELYARFG